MADDSDERIRRYRAAAELTRRLIVLTERKIVVLRELERALMREADKEATRDPRAV